MRAMHGARVGEGVWVRRRLRACTRIPGKREFKSDGRRGGWAVQNRIGTSGTAIRERMCLGVAPVFAKDNKWPHLDGLGAAGQGGPRIAGSSADGRAEGHGGGEEAKVPRQHRPRCKVIQELRACRSSLQCGATEMRSRPHHSRLHCDDLGRGDGGALVQNAGLV